MIKELDLSGENDDVIRLEELYSVTTRILSSNEVAELEAERIQTLRRGAIEGSVLWYEVEWKSSQEDNYGTGTVTRYRPAGAPLTSEDLALLTEQQIFPEGTKFNLFCYTGVNAQRLFEEMDMYDSLFDETGTVAEFEVPLDPSLIPTQEFRLNSLVTSWIKT